MRPRPVLIKEAEQQMLGPDVPLPGVTRLLPSQDDDLTRAMVNRSGTS